MKISKKFSVSRKIKDFWDTRNARHFFVFKNQRFSNK